MLRRKTWTWCAVVAMAWGLVLFAGPARAQVGAATNPYANPYSNPFLNPYASPTQASPADAAYYFLAAQQVTGGIGSGRLGGPRAAAPGGPARAGAARPGAPAEPAPRTGSNTPGAGASRYFNRAAAPSTGNAPRDLRYNRPIRHFPKNGR